MSTFTHAGVSKYKGEFKVRFANGAERVKVLIKNGHSDIDIVELKHAMTKEEAVAYLLEIRFYEQNGVVNEVVKATIEAEQDKRVEKPRAEKQPKEKKVKPVKEKAKPSLEKIRAKKEAEAVEPDLTKEEIKKQLADLEDAPF